MQLGEVVLTHKKEIKSIW